MVMRERTNCWKCCEPFVYALSALVVLISVVFLIAYLLTIFPVTLQRIKVWLRSREASVMGRSSATLSTIDGDWSAAHNLFRDELTPCTQISVHKIWSKSFSNLNSESPVRKCDISNDGIDDIIIGFHVDDSFEYGIQSTVPKCEVDTGDYRQMVRCKGGVLALDGATGKTLWQRWTSYNIFSLHCKHDLNLDDQNDCVAAGRGDYIIAINTRNGEKLWEFEGSRVLGPAADQMQSDDGASFKLFTVNGMRDVDDDRVGDILAVYLRDTTDEDYEVKRNTLRSVIQLISGQTGKLIRTIPTPNQEDVYVPVQVVTRFDGSESILVATGGQRSPGGLYLINLLASMQTSKEVKCIVYATHSSV